MNSRLMIWVIIALMLAAIYIILPKIPVRFSIPRSPINITNIGGLFPLKLGLDLQGGTQLVLQTDMSKIKPSDRDSALESARQVIERRVNLFGVSESVVQSSTEGDQRRILVELPGIQDASAAASLVGQTAQLEFRELDASASATQSAVIGSFNTKSTGLTGADLQSASVVFNQTQTIGQSTNPQVSLVFNAQGTQKFADITKRNLGKPLAIFLDQEPVTAPIVSSPILNGQAVITGNFTIDEAKQLAIQLNAGALPVPIQIIEQTSIGATLGQQSVNRSIVAGVIGLLTVIIFMIAYYGWLGLIADFALIIYSLFVLAIFKTGLFILPPVTLTLAGIAGFILSIGMAVDANILIFERMKEERRWGKGTKTAVDLGFKRAWSSIRDSNISSLITAAILYYIGTGLVKGFAVTLAIGVAVSMFTAIVVTRTILRLLIK